MSTHILSDIEALCDEVAILKHGRLAETGKLGDLLSKGASVRGFEISFAGVGEDVLRQSLISLDGKLSFDAKASGVIVTVPGEDEIDAVLAAARGAGGKLISLQPVKQSLEELFADNAPVT